MKNAATNNAERLLERSLNPHLGLYEGKNTKECLLALLNDLIGEAESIWDYNSIRYETVMTLKEWQEFSKHRERKPYKSMILPNKPFSDKKKVYLDVIKGAYGYYRSLSMSSYKNKLKSALGGLLDCFLNAYYEVKLLRNFDLYMGRSAKDRDRGKVEPTKVALTKLEYAISEYAYLNGRNGAELKRKIMDICEGRLGVLFDYYSTCDIEEGFRYDLKEILKNLQRDYTLAFFDLKLGWEIWKIIHWIGMDVDGFLHVQGFPKYQVIEKRLLGFMTNESYIREILEHMRDELPDCYAKYKKTGCVTSDEIIHEDAQRKGYPKKIPGKKEIQRLISTAKKDVFKYFPLAKQGTPRNIVLNPIHPESTDRAFQSSTRNISGERVNVIVMTPRSETLDTYLPTFAHETAHLMHRIVLEKGEKSGVLPKGATEQVPANIMEYFSLLVEDQFARSQKLKFKKNFEGKEFSDFKAATTTRFQVPFTLIQLGIRKKFDEFLKAGYRDLTEDMLYDLKLDFDRKARRWASLGINVDYERLSAFKIFSSNDPTDGLVYMKKYIEKSAGASSANGRKSMDIQQAFKKRFGKRWIRNKFARALLLWLFLESGRNHKSDKYGDIVMKKEVAECYKDLSLIGIPREKI